MVTHAWNRFKNKTSAVWKWIKDTIHKSFHHTIKTWTQFKDFFFKGWNGLIDILMSITNIIIENIAFIIGVVALILAGITYLLPGRPFYKQLLEFGKNLIGIDSSHPYNTLKHVQASDRTLANASQLVYQDLITKEQIEQKLGADWDLDPHLFQDLGSGLQSHVFVNHNTCEIIIVFRGTEIDQLNDIIIGDGPIALGLDSINAQAINARKFTAEVLNNPRYQGYQPVLTGHSLGGYLALDSGAYFKVPTVTFNAPGKNLFPNLNISLGTSYIPNMLDPKNRKQAINHGLGHYDKIIRNYEYGRDLIGELGHHPGESYHIDQDGTVTKDPRWHNIMPFVSWKIKKTHSIKYFTGQKDDGTPVDAPVIYDHDGNIVPR